MFAGFELADIDTGEAVIRVRHGGRGPAVLLLHGIPETHVMWHKLAPRLAEEFTVVAADLRGYGESSKPPAGADHAAYSKRAMARDQIAVMRALGFDQFYVVGHDRGARCAYRTALDHPRQVRKLAVLDIVPTADALNRAGLELALAFWVWFFLSQPADLPERVLGSDPRVLFDHMLDDWSGDATAITPAARAEYFRAFREPATLHAICEEYRASIAIDYRNDEADRGRRRIECPVLALWSGRSKFHSQYDVLEVWRAWAADVRGRPLDCGHFIPEEAPAETYAELREFFGG
jgi:haloacetate dehalogenase